MLLIAALMGAVMPATTIAALLELSGYNRAENSVANVPPIVLLMGGIPGGFFLLYAPATPFYGIADEKSGEYAAHNHRAAQAAKAASG